MKRGFLIVLTAVVASALTALFVVEITKSKQLTGIQEHNDIPLHRVSSIPDGYPDFTNADEYAVKSVVYVKVTKKGSRAPFSIYDFFYGYGYPNSEPMPRSGAGSGVIISSDGYIITNNHVIDGADEIEITLEDNRSFEAKLVGSDPVTDIALLKIDQSDLSYIKFGDSDSLRLGEWVLAIGNPYELRSTVTAGIVSAKARSMPTGDDKFRIEAFIQTDAAVNPGNSGGALVNMKGELVGINTAIASRTGSYSGYSFAVPSSIAQKVVKDIMEYGSVKRALLGITMRDMDGDLAKEIGRKSVNGVYIYEVQPNGAAQKAGVKSGDILLSINGREVNSAPAVQEEISRFRPKDKISVKLEREGKQIELPVVLQSKSDLVSSTEGSKDGFSVIYGAKLRPASKESLDKHGIKYGIEVVEVNNGKFKSSGIKRGFIITYVNEIPVKDVAQLRSVIERSRRSILIEGIYPDGSVVYYGMGL